MLKQVLLGLVIAPGLAGANPRMLAAGSPGLGNTFYGATNCTGGKIDIITVYGHLDVQNSHINTAKVDGEPDINRSQINTLISSGIVHAHDSRFGLITATANVELYNSSAQQIVIRGKSGMASPVVKLSDGTTVKNITFENGHGLVIESDAGKVTGQVSGGQIQTQR